MGHKADTLLPSKSQLEAVVVKRLQLVAGGGGHSVLITGATSYQGPFEGSPLASNPGDVTVPPYHMWNCPRFSFQFFSKAVIQIQNRKPGFEASSSLPKLISGDKTICFTSQTHSGFGLQTNECLVGFAGDDITNSL